METGTSIVVTVSEGFRIHSQSVAVKIIKTLHNVTPDITETPKHNTGADLDHHLGIAINTDQNRLDMATVVVLTTEIDREAHHHIISNLFNLLCKPNQIQGHTIKNHITVHTATTNLIKIATIAIIKLSRSAL